MAVLAAAVAGTGIAMKGAKKKSKARRNLEAKRAEPGHYSKTGRPGGSKQYTGLEPAGLGGATTPLTP